MDPEEEQLLCDLGRDAEPAGGVLAVGDHEIRAVRIHERP